MEGYAYNDIGNTIGVFGANASASGIGGLFQNTNKTAGAKILVAEDSAGVHRFSVDTSGNVNVIRGTETVAQPLVPVNHARAQGTVNPNEAESLITLDWAFAFPDTNYTATCNYVSPVVAYEGVYAFRIHSVSASSITVAVSSYGATTYTLPIHCIGVHD